MLEESQRAEQQLRSAKLTLDTPDHTTDQIAFHPYKNPSEMLKGFFQGTFSSILETNLLR